MGSGVAEGLDDVLQDERDCRRQVLATLRPGNETYEHFMLKQVAKRWLYDKGVRCIGTEVFVPGDEVSPYGEKRIVDVVGVEEKKKYSYQSRGKVTAVLNRLVQKGISQQFEDTIRYNPNGVHKALDTVKNEEAEWFREALAEEGLAPYKFFEALGKLETVTQILYTVEAKASVSDFRNGFSVAGDYSYVIAPYGLVKPEWLPTGVGLLEVNMEDVWSGTYTQGIVMVTKRPKKRVDASYLTDDGEIRESFREYQITGIKEDIAKRNVNESRYWNPHLK